MRFIPGVTIGPGITDVDARVEFCPGVESETDGHGLTRRLGREILFFRTKSHKEDLAKLCFCAARLMDIFEFITSFTARINSSRRSLGFCLGRLIAVDALVVAAAGTDVGVGD